MPSSVFSTFASCAGLLTAQSFCGASRMRAPLAPPRLSEPRKVEADAHAVDTSSDDGQPRREDGLLERRNIAGVDQLMIDGGNRILPDQIFLRHFGAEIARLRTHVAVHQLEPRARKRVRELIGMLEEAPRDLFVDRIEPQREVGGQHVRRDLLRRVVRVRHRAVAGAVLRLPLMRARRALGQLPFELEQVREEVVAPLASASSST